jgi:hypothetical protein
MRLGLCAALVAGLVPGAALADADAGRELSLAWPAAGTITSPFGQDGSRWHSGLDIGVLRSLTVRAACDGVVTDVGFVGGYEGYGSVVTMNLGGGFSTLYAHLAKPIVQSGQRVWRGERIGIAGCTGSCSGTHLHFELRYRGRPIDPLPSLQSTRRPGLGREAAERSLASRALRHLQPTTPESAGARRAGALATAVQLTLEPKLPPQLELPRLDLDDLGIQLEVDEVGSVHWNLLGLRVATIVAGAGALH